MTTLIRVEWLKMRKYNAFWWILGVVVLAYPGINYLFHFGYQEIVREQSVAAQAATVYLGKPFSFPEVWRTVAFFSSCFVFLPTILVIMFITNEYSFKTHRQNIIDGWSRAQFITSKLADILIITLILTFLYIIIVLVTGFSNPVIGFPDKWGMSYYTGLFALQTFAQLSLAFLVGFLVKKAFLALGIFLFYFFPLEPSLVGILNRYADDIGRFLPLEISDRVIPRPAFLRAINEEGYKKILAESQPHIFYTIILTAFVWFICYRIHARRDLK